MSGLHQVKVTFHRIILGYVLGAQATAGPERGWGLTSCALLSWISNSCHLVIGTVTLSLDQGVLHTDILVGLDIRAGPGEAGDLSVYVLLS